ncbi:MAG: M28 family metallopeptidase [Parcubacteria group bacterium]
MKKLLLAAALAAPLIASCATTAPVTPTLSAEAQRLSDRARILGSDEFEGRGPNTPGEEKAVAYIVQQMRAERLQPGGQIRNGARSWTQDVPLGRFEIAGPLAASYSVGGQTRTLSQGEEVAIRAAQTNADRVTIANAPIVFIGYGVKAPERNWDDFKGADLRGKVALVLVNDPDYETGAGDFGGKAMTYYGRWTYKYEEAARQGLAGILVIHETAPASYGWATVKNSNTNAQFDIVRDNPSAVHVPMEGWVQRDVAVDMLKKAGLDFDTLKKQARSRDFHPVVLPGETFSTDFAVNHSVITSKNVVGIVPGTQRPDETVIYTAHWDHLGVGQPDANGDRIYNGAVDNGTGVAALLELGRLFAASPPPARSVVFLAVTAEEKGLLGSEYYAANPIYPLEKTVADINMDSMGVWGRTHDMFAPGNSGVSLQDELAARLTAAGRAFSPDPAPEAGMFYRSDHFSLAKRGVPAISVKAGVDLLKGGVAAGKAAADDYTAHRYHQPDDEWSPTWDLSGQVEDVNLLWRWGEDLANSTRWPGWKAGSEFKAVRDASTAARTGG